MNTDKKMKTAITKSENGMAPISAWTAAARMALLAIVSTIPFAATAKLNVVATKFSETARKQIEAAGGTCQEIQ